MICMTYRALTGIRCPSGFIFTEKDLKMVPMSRCLPRTLQCSPGISTNVPHQEPGTQLEKNSANHLDST